MMEKVDKGWKRKDDKESTGKIKLSYIHQEVRFLNLNPERLGRHTNRVPKSSLPVFVKT